MGGLILVKGGHMATQKDFSEGYGGKKGSKKKPEQSDKNRMHCDPNSETIHTYGAKF